MFCISWTSNIIINREISYKDHQGVSLNIPKPYIYMTVIIWSQCKMPQWYQFYPFNSGTPQSKCIFGLLTRVRVNMVPLSINHWQKNMNWFTIMIPQTPQTTTKFIELRPTSNFNKITRENRYFAWKTSFNRKIFIIHKKWTVPNLNDPFVLGALVHWMYS